MKIKQRLVRLLTSSVLLVLLVTILLASPVVADTPSRYEYYNAGDDTFFTAYQQNWLAQTFTVSPESHSITSVKLLIYRVLLPGTIVVSVKETDDSGHPTGLDLATVYMDGDSITTSTSGIWYQLNLDSVLSVDYNTKYAIVLWAPEGDSSNYVCWQADGSTATYTGGAKLASTNSGSSWTEDTDDDFMFEVWGEPLIEVYPTAQVFRNYLETDDMLFVLNYENTYTPYYPNDDPAKYFDIRLTDSGGTTVLTQSVCRAWGNKPSSIYLSADTAAPLTPGSSYRLYIYGITTEEPNDYYQLQATDWRGSDLTYLDTWVLTTAHSIAEYYNAELTSFIGTSEVLNEEGGIIFNIGIPALSQVRPNLFQVGAALPGYESTEWTHAFTEYATWDTMVGTEIATIFTDFGGAFGLNGKDFGAFSLLIAYALLVAIMASKGLNSTIIIGLAIPFILLGAWMRFIDIVIVAVVGATTAILLVYSLWFART